MNKEHLLDRSVCKREDGSRACWWADGKNFIGEMDEDMKIGLYPIWVAKVICLFNVLEADEEETLTRTIRLMIIALTVLHTLYDNL